MQRNLPPISAPMPISSAVRPASRIQVRSWDVNLAWVMLMLWDSFRLNVRFNEQPKVSPASKADAPGQQYGLPF